MKKYYFMHIIIITLFLSPWFSGTANSQGSENQMLRDMDIPLMTGLEENIDEALVFDSPDGSIISTQASGALQGEKVFEYYKVVLPSLGWNINMDHKSGLLCENTSVYCLSAIRDQEILLLNISGVRAPTTISYSISPN